MALARLTRYGLLQVTGEDARAFLHGQLTNDVEHLAPGAARYAGWCTAKGRLLATFLVVATQEGFLLQVSRDIAPAVAKRLAMFVLRSKVKVSDVSGSWFQAGLWGEDAPARLQALGLAIPPGTLAATESQGPQGQVAVCVEDGRFLLLSPSPLMEADAAEADWILAEIRAGRALITQSLQDQFVPQMLNLERSGGVDFKKGCYPGQEIVARAQYRGAVKRRMFRLRGEGLQPGTDIFSDEAPGEPAGTVVEAAGGESLAVLNLSSVESGKALRARPAAAALEVLPLPYAT